MPWFFPSLLGLADARVDMEPGVETSLHSLRLLMSGLFLLGLPLRGLWPKAHGAIASVVALVLRLTGWNEATASLVLVLLLTDWHGSMASPTEALVLRLTSQGPGPSATGE